LWECPEYSNDSSGPIEDGVFLNIWATIPFWKKGMKVKYVETGVQKGTAPVFTD